MANPLMNMFNVPQAPTNNIANIAKQFQQFKQTFTGDPEQQVKQLLASGQMTQAQYQQLSQMANALMPIFK